ncbi:MAG: adenosylmethionine--8-amino-7-oxononanoate transaminase [Akkermansiaceae bacterium]
MQTEQWLAADYRYGWHPFTRQDDWVMGDNLVLVSGDGVWLTDSEGRRYIDGNSSIWTNIHGHNHPVINQAVVDQLGRVAHTSYLGFANPRASELAARLCGFFPRGTLERVFFSDDGSTAVECAMKMALQYRMQSGVSGDAGRVEMIAFDRGYHGDTMGAAALGGVGEFFDRFRKLGLPVTHVAGMDELRQLNTWQIQKTAAVVIEPLVQGVNEIRPWPAGMLRELREWCDAHGVHLILDEVMTGMGRTGEMFACQHEGVIPDFLCLAKGLTGGYMPLAATLTTADVYDVFRGDGGKAFYYGHSYTANQLGCAAALASLDVYGQEETLERLPKKMGKMRDGLEGLCNDFRVVHEIRQCGFIAGMELRRPNGGRFPREERVGEGFCQLLRMHGVLTRAILDTVVIMPPLSVTVDELDIMLGALRNALEEFDAGLGGSL